MSYMCGYDVRDVFVGEDLHLETAGRRLDVAALAAFQDAFLGHVILPGNPAYDRARRVWNGMIDRRPALVAQCSCVADVREAVRFAREHRLLLSVRGGGHSVAGFATCEGGMVLDLGLMREVTVDPALRVANVEGGALLSELDASAQRFGLACPVGVVGHTGVGGLTLGGGMGRLQRKYGFTIDNLLAVEMVAADGRLVRSDEDENADLFWALRGAGANFGVVTSFKFRLHPVGPNVVQGLVLFPIERALELAKLARDLATNAPDELSFSMGFGVASGPSASAAKLEGRPVVHLEATHCGPVDEAMAYLWRIRRGNPPIDTFAPKSYVTVQLMEDDLLAWGHRFYMKNAFLPALSDEVVRICADRVSKAPGACWVSVMAQGGAIARVADDDSAFAGRQAAFWCSVETLWDDPSRDGEFVGWARATMAELKPFTTGGGYVNDVVESGQEVVRSIYGEAKHQRLIGLKRLWDPTNLFRLNQNLRP